MTSTTPADPAGPDLPAPVEVRTAAQTTYPWRSERAQQPISTLTRPDIQGTRAGLVTRAIANIIDVVVVVVIVAGIYVAVAAGEFLVHPKSFHFPRPTSALALTVGAAVQGVYFLISWVAGGRTFGDQVLGIRVVGRRGRKVRPAVAALRSVFCVILPIGLLWVAVSRRNRSVQDVVLRTSVVHDWSMTSTPATSTPATSTPATSTPATSPTSSSSLSPPPTTTTSTTTH